MQEDYYATLEVERTATVEVIKKAYRQKAMQHHPDRNPGDHTAEERFKACTEAYDVLSNPDKRARYDQFGHAGVKGAAGAPPPDFSSIFDQFRDIFGAGGGAFEDVFNQGRRGPRRGRGGSDLRIKLPLTLNEIAAGVDKTVRVKKFVACGTCAGVGAASEAAFETCGTCAGQGEVRQVSRSILGQFVSVQPCPACGGEGRRITEPCPECSGEGRQRGEEEITISVPPGVLEGHYLTLRNAGNAGARGGEPGDLRVEIEEIPHEQLTREGLDLYHDLYVSMPDALLGMDAEVPTLDGSVTVRLEAGTQSGKILRLKGRGLPDLNRRPPGEQYVRVHVWTPTRLSSEETMLVEKLRAMPAFQQRPRGEGGGNGHKGFFAKVRDAVMGS